ncbi:hypothetical protein GCM10023317_25640 [Actinopolymorpha pittospori]|uniref:Uncharacterized protein n=1 Tax=Actinopolymorpha pittospori TaxID=648752 RepID=A0A927R8X7_9ACTN|nr:hypothetical protein [Actinopolymorpha pittospori]
MAREVQQGASAENADSWLSEARRVDREFVGVDLALVKAEDSLRMNPRGRQLLHTRLSLRSRMDTLEHCAVAVRSLCRTLLELSGGPHRRALLSDEQLTDLLEGLLSQLADLSGSVPARTPRTSSASSERRGWVTASPVS